MGYVRALLVHPAEMTVEAQLNLHGVQQLIEQEGIPLAVMPASGLAEADRGDADVLVVAEHGCLTDAEEAAIVAAARSLPLVWCGLPREDASAELRALLGIGHAEFSRDGLVRSLTLRDHLVTRPFGRDHEANLKLKYIPHLTAGTQIDGAEVLTIGLLDGMRLAPGLVLRGEAPRRAVFTFPLGLLFALANCRHIDIRTDAEWLDWPVMAYIDVLRALLTRLLRWARPDDRLARIYYWPTVEGARPTGVLSLTHDLCGYSEEGVRWICETCARYGVPTTFFDMPPLRLDAGEVGEQCIALHVPDHTPQEEIDRGLADLRERQGREILGWRRHGATQIPNYPGIWRRIEAAGIAWANTWPAQSHPSRATCSPCGTSNRLPFDLMDLETGRRMELLEIANFDTDDADRLGAIPYGMRLNWEQFVDVVARRLDHAAKHHLIAGYLLHGWTAGVGEESGTTYGAAEARAMLPHTIEQARARGMAIMDGDEIYRWWSFRRACRIEFGPERPAIAAPDDRYRAELDDYPPMTDEDH